MRNRSSIAGLALAVVVLGAALAGAFAASAIFGQSGEPADPNVNPPPQRTPVASPGPPLDCDDPKYRSHCDQIFGLPSPEAQPSPYVPARTDVAPIPFETDLRSDCPQRWLSVGQPGVFSICYPPDVWDVSPKVTGEADDWRGNVNVDTLSDEPVGIRVTFYPRGVPIETDICITGFVTEPVVEVDIGTHRGVTCAGEGIGKWRSYQIEEETSLGLVRATGTVPYTPDDSYPKLSELLEVLATLTIEQ